MIPNDRPDNNFIAKFALICGVVIAVLSIFLLSSIAGPIEVPRLRELAMTKPVPTPMPTPVPAVRAAAASDASGWMALGALLVVMSTGITSAVAVLMARRVKDGRAAQHTPRRQAPMRVQGEAAEMAKTLVAFRETLSHDVYLASREAARDVFWKNEAAKAAAECARREAADAATAPQHAPAGNAREPAVVRNSRSLHSPITSTKTDARE